MKKTIVQLLVAAALMGGAVAWSDDNAQTPPERSLLFPTNADIAEGKLLATDACADCHSLDGISADPALPHLAGQHVVYLYDELHAYRRGDREDESMKKAVLFLSEEALQKVSIYYASLAPPVAAARSTTSSAGAQGGSDPAAADPVQLGKAAAAACAGCHGADGNSQVPGMPDLTAQSPEYFVAAIRAYQGAGRPGTMMNALVSSIAEQSVHNMALYYALQEPRRSPVPGNGDAEAGRAAARACSSCHGADGNVTAADIPTLAGQDALYLAAALRAYAEGKRDHAQMNTATAELGDNDIEALAAFYAGQEPIARKVYKPPTVAEWIERCDRCHGVGGNSIHPRHPSLASQNEAYLVRAIESYTGGDRHSSTMSAMSQQLRPADIEALAAHYASQQRKSVVYVESPCPPTNKP
ncbi:MAG: c-type cytochrome [Woeseia sp.]